MKKKWISKTQRWVQVEHVSVQERRTVLRGERHISVFDVTARHDKTKFEFLPQVRGNSGNISLKEHYRRTHTHTFLLPVRSSILWCLAWLFRFRCILIEPNANLPSTAFFFTSPLAWTPDQLRICTALVPISLSTTVSKALVLFAFFFPLAPPKMSAKMGRLSVSLSELCYSRPCRRWGDWLSSRLTRHIVGSARFITEELI